MSNLQSPNDWESTESAGSNGETAISACAQADELIAAFSIGATDAEEATFVQAHLAVCPDAAHELAAFSKLAEALLHSAAPVEPAAALANQLRRALEPAPFASRMRPARPMAGGRRQPIWRWEAVWAGAAAAAILLLAGLNVYWLQQNLALHRRIDQLIAQQAAQKLAEDGVLILLASEERQAIELPAAQENSLANAEVLWDPEVGVAMLYAKAFPALRPDQAYQLWLTTNGERRSGGLFTVDPSGTGVLVFPVAQPLDNLDSMGVTPEPAGGSPGPTAPAVVRRRFSDS